MAENAGTDFRAPLNRIDQIAALCELLETGKCPVTVKDWGVSHTTLEDVFLKVAAESNFKYDKILTNQEHQMQVQPVLLDTFQRPITS